MNLKFDIAEQREFKKIFGESFFKNMSKMVRVRHLINFGRTFLPAGKARKNFKKINTTNQYFKEGPLINWLKWLKGKFILFVWSESKYQSRVIVKGVGS